jgi:hypothetical protein
VPVTVSGEGDDEDDAGNVRETKRCDDDGIRVTGSEHVFNISQLQESGKITAATGNVKETKKNKMNQTPKVAPTINTTKSLKKTTVCRSTGTRRIKRNE